MAMMSIYRKTYKNDKKIALLTAARKKARRYI
jgi:hypothetical protein